MILIESSFKILDDINGMDMLKNIERAGRVCYKSEERISNDSGEKFVRNIIKLQHESVLEHEKISVSIVCDRGVTHEIVRHRLASYSQESTRYCNYSQDKFGNQITFVKPSFWNEDEEKYIIWKDMMQTAEDNYLKLLEKGAKPEEARSILPNSLKTEIVVTMNLREWRHFFKLRASSKAHPQMREIAIPMLDEFKKLVPVVFEDIVC